MKSKSLKPLILAGIAVTSSACSEREAESPNPNIVFILADDLGWGGGISAATARLCSRLQASIPWPRTAYGSPNAIPARPSARRHAPAF